MANNLINSSNYAFVEGQSADDAATYEAQTDAKISALEGQLSFGTASSFPLVDGSAGEMMCLAAYISGNKANIVFSIPTVKVLEAGDTYNVTICKANIRSSLGEYLGNSSYVTGGYNFATDSHYIITATRAGDHSLKVVISVNPTYWTKFVTDSLNNSPCTIELCSFFVSKN